MFLDSVQESGQFHLAEMSSMKEKSLFIIYLSVRKQLDVLIAICLINELIKTVKCLQRG